MYSFSGITFHSDGAQTAMAVGTGLIWDYVYSMNTAWILWAVSHCHRVAMRHRTYLVEISHLTNQYGLINVNLWAYDLV